MTDPVISIEDIEKPWYQSRTVWSGVVAALAGLGAAVGLSIDQAALTEILLALGSLAGGIGAVWYRLQADTPIKKTLR